MTLAASDDSLSDGTDAAGERVRGDGRIAEGSNHIKRPPLVMATSTAGCSFRHETAV
jgi:hypothetical protein